MIRRCRTFRRMNITTFSNGATAMSVWSIARIVRRRKSTYPAGQCVTQTITMSIYWRRAAWACWCAQPAVYCPMASKFICGRQFVTKHARSNRANRVRIGHATAVAWIYDRAAATAAIRWHTSGGPQRAPYFSKPRGCTIIRGQSQRTVRNIDGPSVRDEEHAVWPCYWPETRLWAIRCVWFKW